MEDKTLSVPIISKEEQEALDKLRLEELRDLRPKEINAQIQELARTGEKSGIPLIDDILIPHQMGEDTKSKRIKRILESAKAPEGMIPERVDPSEMYTSKRVNPEQLKAFGKAEDIMKSAKKSRLAQIAGKVGKVGLPVLAALASGDVSAAAIDLASGGALGPSPLAKSDTPVESIPVGSEAGGGRIMREDDRAMDRKIEALQRILNRE